MTARFHLLLSAFKDILQSWNLIQIYMRRLHRWMWQSVLAWEICTSTLVFLIYMYLNVSWIVPYLLWRGISFKKLAMYVSSFIFKLNMWVWNWWFTLLKINFQCWIDGSCTLTILIGLVMWQVLMLFPRLQPLVASMGWDLLSGKTTARRSLMQQLWTSKSQVLRLEESSLYGNQSDEVITFPKTFMGTTLFDTRWSQKYIICFLILADILCGTSLW